MLLDYFKKIITPKTFTYEYALSAKEVREALYEVFINNKQPSDYDINGGFISDTEFEFSLKYSTTLRGIKAFPMIGIIIPKSDKEASIILTSQSKFASYLCLSIAGIIVLVSFILFLINWDIKSLLLFLGIAFLAPRIIHTYIDAINSALLIRYKKFLHNAVLEAYRSKNYNL